MFMSLNFQVVNDDIFGYDNMPQETILREDMYQATYKSYTIDCGWYESKFITFLIRDADWETPIIKIESNNFKTAKWSINVCKEYLENLFIR
jgi:hypothetical protein